MASFVGLLSPTDIRAGVLQGTLPASADDVDGSVVVKPTSISYGGSSATIGGNGSVTFSTTSVLSLNGVFSSTYRNYMIVCSGYHSNNIIGINMRFRASGSDTTSSTYSRQLNTYGSASSKATSSSQLIIGAMAASYGGFTVHLFNPYASASKGLLSYAAVTSTTNLYYQYAGSLFTSTSYDGFTIFPTSGSITGILTVYGLKG